MIVCHGCLWKYRQIAIGCWLVCMCVFVYISICKMHLHIHLYVYVYVCGWCGHIHTQQPILEKLQYWHYCHLTLLIKRLTQNSLLLQGALLHKARITQVCGIDASHAWLACGHCQFCRALEFRNRFILVTKTSGWLVYLRRALILRPIQHSEPHPSRC